MSGPERSSQEIWESFSQCFTPAVKEVVEFAKGIPGFQELSQHDQVMLLKSGTFQVRANTVRSLFTLPCFYAFNFMAFNSITGADGEVLHFVQR